MKTIKFVPECFQTDGVFTGHLVLKKPSVEDLFKGSAIAKVAREDEVEGTKQMLAWSKDFYSEISVKSVDGSKYESFEDLTSDAECLPILVEVASALAGGLNKKKLMILKAAQSLPTK